MRRNGKDVFKSVFMKDKRCWHKTGPLRACLTRTLDANNRPCQRQINIKMPKKVLFVNFFRHFSLPFKKKFLPLQRLMTCRGQQRTRDNLLSRL